MRRKEELSSLIRESDVVEAGPLATKSHWPFIIIYTNPTQMPFYFPHIPINAPPDPTTHLYAGGNLQGPINLLTCVFWDVEEIGARKEKTPGHREKM